MAKDKRRRRSDSWNDLRATVAAGTLAIESVEDASVEGLARRMQRCWISTIGYSIFSPPRLQFVVCDDVVITVQA